MKNYNDMTAKEAFDVVQEALEFLKPFLPEGCNTYMILVSDQAGKEDAPVPVSAGGNVALELLPYLLMRCRDNIIIEIEMDAITKRATEMVKKGLYGQ